MNSKASGIIIALSSGVAGSLIPTTVGAYLTGNHVVATGLGAIVALNTIIALLHIVAPGGRSVRASGERPIEETKLAPSQPRAESEDLSSRVPANMRRVRSPSIGVPSEGASTPQAT